MTRYSHWTPQPLTENERAAMQANLARLNAWHGLVRRTGRTMWDGPWPRASDLASEEAYEAYLALPNVRSALDRTLPAPQREPAPELEKLV